MLVAPIALACALVGGATMCARPASAQKAPQNPATFSGRVLSDSAERPISGATLSMPSLNLRVVTDSTGRFVISGITPGRQLLTVNQLGYAPLQTYMAFAMSDTVDADILLTPLPAGVQSVAKVSVTANAIPLGLEDFERRRRTVSGDFFDEAMIRNASHGQFADVARRIPGIMLSRSPGGFGVYASAGRGATRGRPCYASVMIDRSWVYEGKRGDIPFDLNSINPDIVIGVEYYRGLSSIPAEFGKQLTTCGTLIIWTKRG
jgi:Carboxypeptidase regulatory-like domain